MVRNARKKPANTAQMYRHFAIVTVGLTALVGVLASGEAEKSVGDQLAAKAERERLAKAEVAALNDGNRTLLREDQDSVVEGGGGSMGAASPIQVSVSSSSNARNALQGASTEGLPIWQQLGVSEQAWLAFTDEQREELKKKLGKRDKLTPQEEAAAMRRMEQASLARSGRTGTGGSDAPE